MKQVTLETVMACLKQATDAYVALADTLSSVSARMDVAVKSLHDRINSVEEEHKTAASQLRNTLEARLEEMRAGMHAANEDNAAVVGASIEAMRNVVQGVSRSSEELRASLMAESKATAERFVAVESSVEGIAAKADTLAAAHASRSDDLAAMGEAVEQIRTQMHSATTSMDSALKTAFGELTNDLSVAREATRLQFEDVGSQLREVNTAIAEAAASITRVDVRLSGFEDDASKAITEMNERYAGHDKRIALASEEASGASSLAGAVNELVSQLRVEVSERHAEAVASVRGFSSAFDEKITVIADNLRAEIDNRAAADEEKAVAFRTQVEAGLHSVREVAEQASKGAQLALEEARLALEAVPAAVHQAGDKIATVASKADAVAQNLEGLASRVEQTEQSSKAAIAEAVEDLNARIDATAGAMRSSMAEAIADAVARVTIKVEDSIAQLSQSYGEITGKLSELPPPAELQAPKLDLRATDTGIEVCLLADDGTVEKAVEVPVSVGMRYAGTYDQSKPNKAGDIVTHNGSLWICNGGNTDAPGKDFTGWRLIVKRGSDGRSIRSYSKHEQGTLYYPGDMLKVNGRLWQAEVKTSTPPEGAQIASNEVWSLISGVL